MNEIKTCPLCGMLKQTTDTIILDRYWHRMDCPNVDLRSALHHAKTAKNTQMHWYNRWVAQCNTAQLWEGKFRTLKQENNKLRERLKKLNP